MRLFLQIQPHILIFLRSFKILQLEFKGHSYNWRLFCFESYLIFPIFKNQLFINNQMTDLNFHKFLPPSQNSNSKFGYLKLNIENLILSSNHQQSLAVKIQFWGQPHPLYLPIQGSQLFHISTSLTKFKHYLIDCKVSQFEIVDSRNYKPIAVAYLNWLTYLRPIEDKQIYCEKAQKGSKPNSPYYLPFFDQIMEIQLPINRSSAQGVKAKKQQKIGELMLKLQCRVYEAEANSNNNISHLESGNNFFNIRVSGVGNRKTQMNPVSITNIDLQDQIGPQFKTNKSILSNKLQPNNLRVYSTDNHQSRKSNNSLLDGGYLRKVKQQREQPQFSERTKHSQKLKNNNELDLELIRMRFQMQELVGSTKKQEMISLQVQHFETISKIINSKDIISCDIKSEVKGKVSSWRLFPENITQQKVFFGSAITLKQGALLNVVITAKKGKQLIRGSVNLDIILETHDINISTSQGVIVGYVRVKVDKRSSVDTKQKPLKEKIDQIKQLSFQDKKTIAEPAKIMRKQTAKRQQIKNDEQISQQQQKNQIQAYYLLLINQNGQSKLNRFKFRSFDMQIGQNNSQKFILTSQNTVINKPLSLQVFEKDICIMNEILIQKLPPTPISIYNLTCSLVFQKRFANFDANCQLYSGSIQQINFLIQKIMAQKAQLQPKRHRQQPSRPLVTQQSNRNSLVAQFQQQINRQQNRKLKTEAYGVQNRERMLTQQKISGQSIAIDKFQNASQNNQAQQENIYLVDLFTRFLQCLPEILIIDSQYISREDFLQMLLPQIQNSSFQIELVEIIISIFQESNNDKINCLALIQCHKAFRSFLNLYRTQRTELLNKILEAEPKAVEKIKSNSQLGTLNESVLWGRALNRIKDPILKQRINKLYKISAFGSIDATLLLEDLNPINKEFRSLDISNLGMMIKQWVEDFILKAEPQNIITLKQKLLSLGQEDNIVNIRSVSDTIQVTLGLRLSLWESLMLIEEIKGSYGCDNQLQQGVISSVSLVNWIDSVRRRAKANSQNNSHISDSQVSLDEEQLAMIKQIKKQPKNMSMLSKKDVSKHRSESISQLALNNESDIADIANLLREKDGFMNMDMIQQTQNDYKPKLYDPQTKYPQFLLPDQSLKNKQPLECKKVNKQYSSESQEQNNKDIINIPKQRQQPKKQKVLQFSIRVQQLKLYNETSLFPLYKEIISFQNQEKKIGQQYFYYVTMAKKYSQSNGKGNKFIIPSGNRAGTIKIALHDQDNNLKFSGILPLEQVSDCIAKKEENRKKTIVLYESNRKIGGKIVISFNFQKQDIINSAPLNASNLIENSQKVYITLHKIAPANKQLQLFAKIQQSGQQKVLYLNEQIELSLNKPVYHCQLKIFDESNSFRSLISLQELFIRNVIRQSYPLIDVNAGNYIATLSLTLSYNSKNGNLVQSRQQQFQQSLSHVKQNTVNQIEKDKQLILINSVIAFGYKQEYKLTPKLHCIISNNQRDDNHQKLALVTPQFTLKVGDFGTKYQFKHQKIDIQNYEQCYLQLKLVQSGRTICYSQKFKLSQIQNSINSNIIIMSIVGENNALFAVSFKKIGFSEDRFMLRRLINCLQQVPVQLQSKNIDSLIKNLKGSENLTITEQNMLKCIFENNLSTKNYIINNSSIIQYDFSFIYNYSNFERAKYINEILSQFIHFDIQTNRKITGYLKVKQLNEITQSLAQQLPKKLIEQIQDANRLINNLQQPKERTSNSKMNYMWLLIGIQGNKEVQTLQVQEKRHIISQIDGIYESLKLRYG